MKYYKYNNTVYKFDTRSVSLYYLVVGEFRPSVLSKGEFLALIEIGHLTPISVKRLKLDGYNV